jgi:acetyltransferase-like isoleucine patch superfamily enzyme
LTKFIKFLGKVFWSSFFLNNKCNILVFNRLIHFICSLRGVKVGKNVKFNGFPVIRRHPESNVLIGNDCVLNSAKKSVEINLYRPCTFVTVRRNAEIIFGNNSGASGVTFIAAKRILIGNNVMIGAHSTIIDNDIHHSDPKKRYMDDFPTADIVIEDNVFIGFNCFILKGVTIGENSVIGANSVVINSIPRNSIAIGNPCKIIIRKNWD